MSKTVDELRMLILESGAKEEKMVKAYRATHKLPSRGIISDPEIDAEREKQKQLMKEYLKLIKTEKPNG